ncbi:hypothetical protein Rhopal_006913-T1 [Rhodotorula paludigena]|uniref:non-specific serine/threonine protein kinase n=1 Tax=Rhodotorula paludigena TaxID=86838 RepID=A0AAV5GV86_9BASI|nr:hypothetical protein Rhopal_006913-T1 [Rhodotorula paludigena]
MSASLSGNFPLTSANKSRRRRPSASGLSLSSPDVPQLHSMPTRNESPNTHPPQAGPYLHPHTHGHDHRDRDGSGSHRNGASGHSHGHGTSGIIAAGLSLTPISPASSSSATSPHSVHSPGGPASSSLSLTSISSASTTHTTQTGISRASSVRSTSSVQAVPIRKPQRGPTVPRIVTRGINAIGAYGVPSAPNSAQSPTRAGPAGTPFGEWKGKARAPSEETMQPMQPGSSAAGTPSKGGWGRRRGNGGQGGGFSPLPSPVNEGGSSGPSSPANGSETEGWRVKGSRTTSPPPAHGGRSGSGGEAGGWTRPKYERAESSRLDDAVRVRQRSAESSAGGSAATNSPDRRGASLSPPISPAVRARQHEREASSASGGSTQGPQSPRSPRVGQRPDWAAAGEARRAGDGGAAKAPLIGMTPNAMGVVGNRRSTEDFEFGEVLGEGSYSTVTHVTTVHPPYREYALKVLDKEHIKRERKTKYVLIERDTLKTLDGHPGIIKLWWTFQDEWSLYYVLEFAENGELLHWIKKYGSFDLRSARYYLSQILSAVAFMHEKGVIHRDLKPENILLDRSMRVKITDFGTAKLLKQEEVAFGASLDEILSEGKESSFSSDFWALGCILFQLLAGRPPFQARTEYLMFQKIIKLEYEFPLGFPTDAKDLVEKLLIELSNVPQVVDPKARLGGDPSNGNGIEAVQSHPFFTSRIDVDARPPAAPPKHRDHSSISTWISDSANSSLRTEPSSAEDNVSTPASSLPPIEEPETSGPVETPRAVLPTVESLASMTSGLALDSPLQTPPASSTPVPHDASLVSPHEDPLDGPIDWQTIWTVDPPEIRTGLTPPAPVIKGEFVLLGGDDSIKAPSTTATGLTGDQSWIGSRPGTVEDGDDDWDNEVERGSVSDDDYDAPGSPTSTSGRDLPPASTFGGGKWSNVLLPSEMILMCSPILQRPSSGAVARSALLRSPRIKFPNPLYLISSSSSNSSQPASPHNGTVPLPTPSSGSTGSSSAMAGSGGYIGSLPSPPLASANSAPTNSQGGQLPTGWKPRTLILTDYPRLLCIKESADKITVKSEVFLGSALRGGVRREGVSAFIHAEPTGKDGRGFTVKTSSRNYKYEEPSGQAMRWIQELREAHQAGLMAPKPRK